MSTGGVFSIALFPTPLPPPWRKDETMAGMLGWRKGPKLHHICVRRRAVKATLTQRSGLCGLSLRGSS